MVSEVKSRFPDQELLFQSKPPGFFCNLALFPWSQTHLPQTAAGQGCAGPSKALSVVHNRETKAEEEG